MLGEKVYNRKIRSRNGKDQEGKEVDRCVKECSFVGVHKDCHDQAATDAATP